jgi:hypothetical protein
MTTQLQVVSSSHLVTLLVVCLEHNHTTEGDYFPWTEQVNSVVPEEL